MKIKNSNGYKMLHKDSLEKYEKINLKEYSEMKINKKNIKEVLSKKRYILILLLYIFIIFFMILIIFLISKIKYTQKEKNVNDKAKNYPIEYDEELNNKRQAFIEQCIKGKLLDTKIYKPNELPKISVIIPCYNDGKYLLSAVTSVRNQLLKDLEIIIVNDGSTKKQTKKLIKTLASEEPRIRIIENKENKGQLYSVCSAVLKAIGNYITELDSDDLFLNENVLQKLYYDAEHKNLDILEFNVIRSEKYKLSTNQIYHHPLSEKGFTLSQPELSDLMYRKNKTEIRRYYGWLWGKLIKSKIFKKTVIILGPSIYNVRMSTSYDYLLVFALLRNANSYEFINYIGLYTIIRQNSFARTKNRKNIKYACAGINYFKVLYELTNNTLYDKTPFIYEVNRNWQHLVYPYRDYNCTIQLVHELYEKVKNNSIIPDSLKKKMSQEFFL